MLRARRTEPCRMLLVLGVFFGWALLSAPLHAQEKVENLVNNPDFEFGKDGWSVWVEDPANAGVQWDVDQKEGKTDKDSLLIDIFNAGKGQRVELHQNPFSLQKGQKMTFALWIKSEKVRQAKLIVNHRAAPWTSYGSKAVVLEDAWKEYWTAAEITANDAKVGIYVELRDQRGKVWFDHVRFYEGEYAPEKELGGSLSVSPRGRLAMVWGAVKSRL